MKTATKILLTPLYLVIGLLFGAIATAYYNVKLLWIGDPQIHELNERIRRYNQGEV
jgi:hypothetical protein